MVCFTRGVWEVWRSRQGLGMCRMHGGNAPSEMRDEDGSSDKVLGLLNFIHVQSWFLAVVCCHICIFVESHSSFDTNVCGREEHGMPQKQKENSPQCQMWCFVRAKCIWHPGGRGLVCIFYSHTNNGTCRNQPSLQGRLSGHPKNCVVSQEWWSR